MKALKFLMLPSILSFFIAPLIVAAYADEEKAEMVKSAFTIERMVIAGSIENRKPSGIVNTFAASTELIHCFLEAKDIAEDVKVTFVWYHNGKAVANVELPLHKGPRWRTHSNIKPAGRQGDWKVELQDAGGMVLDAVTFTVE